MARCLSIGSKRPNPSTIAVAALGSSPSNLLRLEAQRRTSQAFQSISFTTRWYCLLGPAKSRPASPPSVRQSVKEI